MVLARLRPSLWTEPESEVQVEQRTPTRIGYQCVVINE